MRAHTTQARLHNFPADLTSFIGRRRELADVKQRLGAARLVTLTGPGGVGKTRLAVRVGAEIARAFSDGVWMIELAGIEDPPLVTQAVFHGLGLQDTSAGWSLSRLADFVEHKRLLLVLDNCEHLLDACAVLVTSLLRRCPDLRILATSREPLGAEGEVRVRVPPLSLPDDEDAGSAVAISDAVSLLAERAAAVDPSFVVDASNAAAAARLCRRLDGMPLAIELAAARLEALGLDQLNELLDRELLTLSGKRGGEPRQQTLEATVAWSYRLLSEQEQRLWARLSIFADTFDEPAAKDVCSDPTSPEEIIVALLAALVEKSILKREPATGPHRYRLLETLRQFGRERLHELGAEEARILRRHRDWVHGIAAAAGSWDGRQADAFNRVYAERNNLWSALDFCVHEPAEAAWGIDICCQLYAYWNARGPLNDARRVVGALLERVDTDSLERARGLWLSSGLAIWHGDNADGRRAAEESLRIGRLLGNDEVVAWALGHLGVLGWVEGRFDEALRSLESAIELATAAGRWATAYWAKGAVCGVHLVSGDLPAAIATGEEAAAAGDAMGELWGRGIILGFLAEARFRRGDWDGAIAGMRKSLDCKLALDDRVGLASRLESIAWMLADRGSAEQAAVLLGCAARTRESIGPIFPAFAKRHERSVAMAREQLGEQGYEAAFLRGRSQSVEEVVAYSFGERPKVDRAPAKHRAFEHARSGIALTRRELEIAALVAEGLSNKEIAERLVISERTAETHVWNIFNKLGMNSRAQVASWAATEVLKGQRTASELSASGRHGSSRAGSMLE